MSHHWQRRPVWWSHWRRWRWWPGDPDGSRRGGGGRRATTENSAGSVSTPIRCRTTRSSILASPARVRCMTSSTTTACRQPGPVARSRRTSRHIGRSLRSRGIGTPQGPMRPTTSYGDAGRPRLRYPRLRNAPRMSTCMGGFS